MNIAIIGYGKMGHIIERIATERGHQIVLTIDHGQEELFDDPRFLQADVAIEFTSPASAYLNCSRCLDRSIPVVCGSTGWAEHLPEMEKRCEQENKTLFWASNFSVGMNLFFELNKTLARLMNAAPQYAVSMTETHHIHKVDAPSGTAITLAEGIIAESKRLRRWESEEKSEGDVLPIYSLRQGEVPGTHTIEYKSPVDSITITHEAFGREGFALGAVLAAEYTASHSGYLTMQEMLNQ
ncbi:4-hydroxy-tetrahydrodipicolinate reductase [Porphyromonas pogonae]|uniref:4-hydroxy-tetrahydrodipicolinate reductase n=1 Tax=Porphyromonas pogonae TaxID=867595 RepID=UPI002E771479|nr:dihydrodipicolinate reductase C-terminal domain-containing protein [Porphyromonas pogonae]